MIKMFAAALALCLVSGATSAATLSVVRADCGLSAASTGLTTGTITCGANDRRNTGNVNFGAADGAFYSLGLNGAIIFEITPAFTGPAMIVEVTNPSNHREAANVLGSLDGTAFTLLGTVSNVASSGAAPLGGTATLSFTGVYNFLALVDISKSFFETTGSTDGFDVDALSVAMAPAPVPVPAAGFLLLGGLGALGLLRRRRNAVA
jgi:hypothetical protein